MALEHSEEGPIHIAQVEVLDSGRIPSPGVYVTGTLSIMHMMREGGLNQFSYCRPRTLNVASHTWWLVRCPGMVNALPHTLHLNGFCPVWMRMCALRLPLRLNDCVMIMECCTRRVCVCVVCVRAGTILSFDSASRLLLTDRRHI